MTSIEEIYRKLTNVDITQQKLLWDERGKGYYGEFLVFCELYPSLPGNCKILMNITIPSVHGKVTEIDLLLLHETGAYVFEMKHYKGTIYGKPYEQSWTQYFRTAPNQHFRSPIKQNQYHIDALKKIVPGIPIHSFVVFTSCECELKVECNEPDITVCTLSFLRRRLSTLTSRPAVLSMEQIDILFRTLLNYSPTTQHTVAVDGNELPFYEYVSAISANYAERAKQLENDARVKIDQAEKDCQKKLISMEADCGYSKMRSQNTMKITIVVAVLMVLTCVIGSVMLCKSYQRNTDKMIASAQQELASFAQKFEQVKDFNNGDLKVSRNLITCSDVNLAVTPDLKNAVSFSCSLVWNGSDYGVSIGNKAVLIVILNDGSIKECPVYNDLYPYISDYRMGKSNSAWYLAHSEGSIPPHDFYDISVTDIAYIKLSNVDLWIDVRNHPQIVASGYEIELYRAGD